MPEDVSEFNFTLSKIGICKKILKYCIQLKNLLKLLFLLFVVYSTDQN